MKHGLLYPVSYREPGSVRARQVLPSGRSQGRLREFPEAPHQQPAADGQHESECHFPYGQHIPPGPGSPPVTAAARGLTQDVGRRPSHAPEHRGEPEQRGTSGADRENNRNTTVSGPTSRTGSIPGGCNTVRARVPSHPSTNPERAADRSARRRAFRQRLPYESPPAGAERPSQHDLAFASCRANEHADSRHWHMRSAATPCGSEQQHERPARASDEEYVHVAQIGFHMCIGLGVLLLRPP